MIREEEQLGIVPLDEAQELADEAGLDLVEVAPTADPPVCLIMDYGKYKYEQAKRDRESRRGSRHVQMREVRMKVRIDEHDLDFKARIARKLLEAGDKVKVSVMFRAREITHPEVGRDLLDRFVARIEDIAKVERSASMEGRFMSIMIEPMKRERVSRDDAAKEDDGTKESAADAAPASSEADPVAGGR